MPVSIAPVFEIIGIHSPIPNGWRIVTYTEAQNHKDQILKLLDPWGIVGFDHGKLDGSGYGGKFSPQYG